jgi:hypothetical protein
VKLTSERRQDLRHSPRPADARDSDWYQFLRDVEDLIASGRRTWAVDWLERMRDTVERTCRVTLAQRRAYENIKAGNWRVNVDDWDV